MSLLADYVRRAIYNLGVPGSYRALEGHLKDMPPEAIEDLHRLLREAGDLIAREKRAVRLWPGGPSLHG